LLGFRIDHGEQGGREAQVGKCLREIPQVAAVRHVDLFRVEAERARERQQLGSLS
jgi:hypothetical protein